MQTVHDMAGLRAALRQQPGWALVPTMGNLHAGHLALVERARALRLPVAASVFVNPLQFGPGEDFERYPRTLERDSAMLREAGCELLFAPSPATMYPQPQTFRVLPDPQLAGVLDGAARPGHFEGVCTVVMKLLQLVQPRAAVFGKKDYQQLMLIRAMAEQFALPVEIIGLDTVRDADGLALSSRNGYLDPRQRQQAPQLAQALASVAAAARALGDAAALEALEQRTAQQLQQQGWGAVDYISVRRRTDLQRPLSSDLLGHDNLVVLGAARLGSTRLIDNKEF